MAEYVFEKLEPYLTGEEIAECALKLQELALDRLEQYGFSREDLEDMAEAITQDFLGENAHVVKVESVSIPHLGMLGAPEAAIEATVVAEAAPPEKAAMGQVAAGAGEKADAAAVAEAEEDAAPGEPAGEGAPAVQDGPTAHAASAMQAHDQQPSGIAGNRLNLAAIAAAIPEQDAPTQPPAEQQDDGVLRYRNLAGYDEAVSVMRDFGIGLQNDPGFIDFVRMLNNRHGLSRMPAIDTLLFRAPIIEDASRFAEATVGELGLPVLRMTMEEGMGGMPVLCVTTQGNNRPRMNHAHNRFEGPGILVIEDLDAWVMPDMPEGPEGFGGFMMANISRGAREAVNLIRSAVEDPDVFVLATASTAGEPDPFFYEILEPITIVDIGYPTDKERADIWAEIARDHPSVRDIDRSSLVRFSEGLARYDMYMAAREAVEEAYKLGLVQHAYVPVSPQNLLDKLAGCQPIDSEQYRELEDAVVDDFRNDLAHLEDLLGGD